MLDGKQTQADVLSFDVATVAIKGMREYQEDSLISSFPLGQDTGFAVLSDGMGGHTAGHVASALVVAEVFSQLKMKDLLLEDGVLNIPTTLQEAAEAANARVADYVAAHDDSFGMGATLLSMVIRRDKLYWLSVGDSPLLLFRDGALRQLNKDHSMAPQIDMMVKTGALSKEAGRDHPDRNTLTSAISGEAIEKIDCPTRPIALLPDDILIAASDGLQFLPNSVIARLLKQTQDSHSVDIANALMDALEDLDHPDQDNAAFVVIRLGVGHEEKSTAVDLADLPVLATADDDDDDADAGNRKIKVVTAPDTTAEPEATAEAAEPETPEEPAADPDRERKAYWYRGQKYYKD